MWSSYSYADSGRISRRTDQCTSQLIDTIKAIADVEDEELDE